MREQFSWKLGRRSLRLGARTLVMGVLNVTPDSFSDGGLYADKQAAIEHALRMIEEGADIVDVGGESTRPGVRLSAAEIAGGVGATEEIERTIPVIEGILRGKPEAVISIDTYKAGTARSAVEAGAQIINDVSGFSWDSEMAHTASELGCGIVLTHTRGTPNEWRGLPSLPDPVELVLQELSAAVGHATKAGITPERLVVDPGFGFGKRLDENYPLLARFHEFAALGLPLLAGPSRKSFIGRTVGKRLAEITEGDFADVPASQRLAGTLAAATACVLQGAHIVRVHDVRASVEAMAVADAILAAL
jgi:dihydropteroate synthase